MLTPREKEVLEYICKGYTNEEIAKALFISVSTAKAHVANILDKYSIRNRTYLAYLAGRKSVYDEIKSGILTLDNIESFGK